MQSIPTSLILGCTLLFCSEASCGFPSLIGNVFEDQNVNGQFDTGEELGLASILLYEDDGDGLFSQSFDTLIAQGQANSDGAYRFDDLTPNGNYFLVQPQQELAGGTYRSVESGPLAPITQTGFIDAFMQEQAAWTFEIGEYDRSKLVVLPDGGVVGNERDLGLTQTVEVPFEPEFDFITALTVDEANGTLNFHQNGTAISRGEVVWDGRDPDFSDVPARNLGSLNLTSTGNALAFLAGTDSLGRGQRISFRGFSDSADSRGSVRLPETADGTATSLQILPFSEFTRPDVFEDLDAFRLHIGGSKSRFDAQFGPIMIISGAQHNIATRLVPEPALPTSYIVVAGFFVITFARPSRQL